MKHFFLETDFFDSGTKFNPKTLLILFILFFEIISCSNKKFLSQVETINFEGLSAISLSDNNQTLDLSWARPDYPGELSYKIYLKDLGPSDGKIGTVSLLSLSASQLPSVSGQLIATVTIEQFSHPLDLKRAHLYGVQVRALSSFGNDENLQVYGFIADGLRQTASVPTVDSSLVVKILEYGTGSQPEVTTASVQVGSASFRVKAALVEKTSGSYVEDLAVTWSLVGGGFNEADLTGSPSSASSIIFSPTKVGSGSTLIQATCLSCGDNVVSTIDTTSTITITQTLTPALMLVDSGGSQSAVVNNVLSTALKAKVSSADGTPIPGIAVNFSAAQGGGSLITAQPVLTDANGIASSSAKLSTSASTTGTANHIFRATVVSNPALTADFSALALPGPAYQLEFSRDPANAFRNFAFLTQPVVEINDQYGNKVSTAIDDISLNLKAGTGTGVLSGTTLKTASQGLVTFDNVTYDSEENNVQLEATAPGLIKATSSPFNVGPVLVSACSLEDIDWKTANGGCEDLSTHLVWSAKSATSLTYFEAIWDAFAPGGGGESEIEDSDKGWTNEYLFDQALCSGLSCDTSPSAYCHDLVQGGKSDWRLPTASQIVAAAANGLSNHIAGTATLLMTRNPHSFGANVKVVHGQTGAPTYDSISSPRAVLCVRAGTPLPSPSKLSFSTASTFAVTNQVFSLTVKVLDSLDRQVNKQNLNVTLVKASGSGTLSGTLTRATNAAGQAIFNNLSYDTNERFEITASANNLTAPSLNFFVEVSSFPGGCHDPDGSTWETTEGGCKQLSSGLVWSKSSSATMGWQTAFWDNSVVGAGAIEASDQGWSNEYLPTSQPCQYGLSSCDAVSLAYCHDLAEGGYSDWRLPTSNQILSAVSDGLATQTSVLANGAYWTNSRDANLASNHGRYNFANSSFESVSTSSYAVCVRNVTLPQANKIKIVSSSPVFAKVGDAFTFNAQILSAGNIPVNRSGVNLTLGLLSGTGNLSGNVSTSTDAAGYARFSLSYDTAETITLEIQSNDAGLNIDTNTYTINVSSFPGGCLRESASFTSADGGCRHNGSGSVWSKQTSAIYYSQVNTTSYCDSLIEGGYSDWRLPATNESFVLFGEVGNHLNFSSNYIVTLPNTAVELNSGYQAPNTYGGKVSCVRP